MADTIIECKNCRNKFQGKFCNNCGQQSNTKRINFSYLLDQISNSLLQLEHGFFFTIKELFTRPGHSIREFIEGKRKRHFKPLAFVLITSSIYLIAAYFADNTTYLEESFSGIAEGIESTNKKYSLSRTKNILNWLSTHSDYATLVLLPLFSFASVISFARFKYNFVEHLILNIYITGQQTLIFIVFILLNFVIDDPDNWLQVIASWISTLCIFWTFFQFFNTKKTISKLLLTVLTGFLYYTFIFIIMFMVGFLEIVFTH
ncbi:MAG: DUF3667 domain-containing protein [Flavobacteriales bacterium]|nr:DUF3667 domain-containing protein [Flavobacteriales bacterium]